MPAMQPLFVIEKPRAAPSYTCPGQSAPISRTIHLARLGVFYPPCRDCRHQHDQAGLAPRVRAQLASWQAISSPAPARTDALCGDLLGGFDARVVGRAVRWLGRSLWQSHNNASVVLVAGDGRAETAGLVLAAIESLRWAGCQVVSLGAASAPAMRFALKHLQADGALLVGNPAGGVTAVGIRFLQADGQAWQWPGGTNAFEADDDWSNRPTRRFGQCRSLSIEAEYIEPFLAACHGLRPLRVVAGTSCCPVRRQIDRLASQSGLRPVWIDGGPPQVVDALRCQQGHLGAWIDDDGRRLHLWTEKAEAVEEGRLLHFFAAESAAADDALGQLLAVLRRLSTSDRAASLVLDSAGKLD